MESLRKEESMEELSLQGPERVSIRLLYRPRSGNSPTEMVLP